MSEPRLWDYREQRWGWSATYGAQPVTPDDWSVVRTMGFGVGLAEGDYVALAGPAYRAGDKSAVSVYRLTEFSYVQDPPDMWKAVLVHTTDGFPTEFATLALEQVFYVRPDR